MGLLDRLGLVRRRDMDAVVERTRAEVAAVAPVGPSPEDVARAIMQQAGLGQAEPFAFNNPHLWQQQQPPQRRPLAAASIDTLRALADNYDILRACIEHLKREVAAVPISIVARSGEDTEVIRRRINQAQQLFTKEGGVGRAQTYPEHFEQAMLEDAIVIGSPAIYHRYDRGGAWLWCDTLDAGTIRPVTDPKGWEPEGGLYEQWVAGVKTCDLSGRDLTYDRLSAVSWQPYSRSPVEWLIHSVNRALRIDAWNLTWFTDGTTPADLLGVPDTWKPEQIIAFTNWYNAILTGNTAERVKTRFVPGGMTRLGSKASADTSFTEQELWLLRRTCAITGVQPASIGFTGEQYKVSQDESMGQTTRFGAGVLLRLRKRTYDDILVRAGFGDLETSLPQQQTEKPKERAEREEIEIRSGRRTINEIRAEAGEPPLEGADAPLVASTLKPLDQVLAPPEPAPTPAPAADPAADPTNPARRTRPTITRRDSIAQASARYRSAMEAHSDAAVEATLGYWQGAESEIRTAWESLIEQVEQLALAGNVTEQQLAQEKRYRALLTAVEEQVAGLARDAASATTEAQSAGIAAALAGAPEVASIAAGSRPTGASLSWVEVDRAAVDALIGFASDGSPLHDLFDAIGPDIAARATQALVSGLVQGEGPAQIARAIEPILGSSRARAENIARTEVHRAMREAQGLAFEANADVVEGWVWTAALTTRTCPACWAMHGTIHPTTERLDGHPQCRCVMVPRTRSWGELVGDPDLEDDRPAIETGEAAFGRLSADQQREVLGEGLFGLWEAGGLAFADLAVRQSDARWGDMMRPITLQEATAASVRGAEADLRRWERKALRRLRESRTAVCAFESAHIPAATAARIAAGLAEATDPDTIRALFRAEDRL